MLRHRQASCQERDSPWMRSRRRRVQPAADLGIDEFTAKLGPDAVHTVPATELA
jgi:hypothetical protein